VLLEADEPLPRVSADVRKMIGSPWGPDEHVEMSGNKEEKNQKDVPDGGDPPVDNKVEVEFAPLEDMIATDQDEDLGKDDYKDEGEG